MTSRCTREPLGKVFGRPDAKAEPVVQVGDVGEGVVFSDVEVPWALGVERAGVPALDDALAFPATVGELWMIGYLLVRGVRRHALNATAG